MSEKATEPKKDKDDIREAVIELTKEVSKLVVEVKEQRKEWEKWRVAGKF